MSNIPDEAANQPHDFKSPKFPRNKKDSNQKIIDEFTQATKMLEQMKEMGLDIKEKLASLYELSKQCNFDLEKYIQYTYKHSSEEIEEHRKALNEKILAAIPPETCTQKRPKSTERLTQERKGKTRGARKNWIPMQ